jgi:hypothetical protein
MNDVTSGRTCMDMDRERRHTRRTEGACIGSALLKTMLDRCWARGCYKVTLTSGFVRAEIHGFYESLGFDKTAKQAFVMTRVARRRESD